MRKHLSHFLLSLFIMLMLFIFSSLSAPFAQAKKDNGKSDDQKSQPACHAKLECLHVSTQSNGSGGKQMFANTLLNTTCPDGYQVVGGGMNQFGSNGRAASYPNDNNGWSCMFKETMEPTTCFAQCCKVVLDCQ